MESRSDESAAGARIFRENCASCHAPDKILSGPALRGVLQRGPWAESDSSFFRWVRNPEAFIPTTPYTAALLKQYGQIMPAFPHLDSGEVRALRDYLQTINP